MQSSQRNIPSLDGLRAVSIMLVIISHASINFWEIYKDSLGKTASIIQVSLLAGHLGVTIFFVISGFLITTLLLREQMREQKINLFKFYFRRTFRIFPPYYVYLGVILLLAILGVVEIPLRKFISPFTYTTNYFPDVGWFLAHSWSLSVEEQFYLLFPAFLMFLGRKRIVGGICLVIAAAPLFRLFYLLKNPMMDVTPIYFETIADSLASGCLLAVTRDWLHTRKLYSILLQSNFSILTSVLLAFGINWISHFPKYYSKPLYLGLLITVQNAGIVFCVDYFVTNSEGKAGRFLNAKPIVFIGTISYSLYLWQEPFLTPLLDLPFIVKFLLIIIVAVISYYFVEKPSLKLRNYLEGRWFRKKNS